MVVAIVKLTLASRDDASCAAVPDSRRRDGVLPVITALADGQQTLEIAEGDAVARIRKRTAVAYRAHRALGFRRQLRECDRRQRLSFRGAACRRRSRERED